MRCEQVRRWMPKYVEGTLSAAQVAAMDAHLDCCATCAKALNDYFAAHGTTELTPEEQELLRLMRLPSPSAEQVQAGVAAVLRTIQAAETVAPLSTTNANAAATALYRLNGATVARRAYGLAAIVVGLLVLVWWGEARYRALERQFTALTAMVETLRQQNDALRRENAALQRRIAATQREHERTRKLLWERQRRLEERISQLQRERGQRQPLQSSPPLASQPLIVLRDGAGTVTINADGSVQVAGKGGLPPSLARLVRELVTTGAVLPQKPALLAMAHLNGGAMRSALQEVQQDEVLTPLPLSPVLTGVRSLQPTLRWTAVEGAQKYQVTVADLKDTLLWQGAVTGQTQVTLPAGVLRRGQVYFWQVEAFMAGQSVLSPAVGFWVIEERALREVEAVERAYPQVALVRASVYAVHGLYEEALQQVEQLKALNPTNPFVQTMWQNLRRQLGKAE